MNTKGALLLAGLLGAAYLSSRPQTQAKVANTYTAIGRDGQIGTFAKRSAVMAAVAAPLASAPRSATLPASGYGPAASVTGSRGPSNDRFYGTNVVSKLVPPDISFQQLRYIGWNDALLGNVREPAALRAPLPGSVGTSLDFPANGAGAGSQ